MRGTNSSKASFSPAEHTVRRIYTCTRLALTRSCAHKRTDSTQTLCVHELLAARALTQSRFSGCTHAHWPLSVHARIGLLIGACRSRLGSTNFGTPLYIHAWYFQVQFDSSSVVIIIY